MPEAFGLSVPTRVEQLADPSRTAVIIYDMQVGIISQIKEGAAILERCVDLVAAAREGGYRIFFTRHMWLPLRAAPGLCWPRVGRPRASWVRHVSARWTPGAQARVSWSSREPRLAQGRRCGFVPAK